MLDSNAQVILELVVDDSFGLWEIAERFKALRMDLSSADAVALAQRTTLDLVREGLLSVWLQRAVGGEELALSENDAKAALAEIENWDWPHGSAPMVRVLATEAGEHAYYGDGSRHGD